ncbi:MAG: hypothetical protein WCI71_06175, partial [Bacteroidota bacterium]
SEVLAISDSYELSSAERESLISVIKTHPAFKSVDSTKENILVYFNKDVDPGEINSFFFTKGVTLTHLAERKRSLEQHFLELLHNDQ